MKGRKDGISPFTSNQVVAELGHELGNVLNGLLGMTRLMRDSAVSAEQERWLKAIEQSGQQLHRLVESFRHGPVPHGTLMRSQPAELDGIELLEQALLAHMPAAIAHSDRLLLIVAPELPRRWDCDPCLLRQLVDNLLGNALKFTHNGEVVLEAGLEPAGGNQPGALLLAVIDSGPGVDATFGRQMFGAFERGSNRVRDGGGGYGLGLFICRRIVQALGGGIGWSTPTAGGARFQISLPGVLSEVSAKPIARLCRSLKCVECRLDLTGDVQRSVTGCLARLGIAWRRAGQPAGVTAPGRDLSLQSDRLVVAIGEKSADAPLPGPRLWLRAESDAGEEIARRSLGPPVLECSLGAVLLELALEWLWLRNEGPD